MSSGKTEEETEQKRRYKIALKYYRENEGKSVQIPYAERLKLVAYTQQALHGSFTEDKVKPLGAFDVIGKDRRNAWCRLGDISKEEAMNRFIDGVSQLMPDVKSFLETEENQSTPKENSAKRINGVSEGNTRQENENEKTNGRASGDLETLETSATEEKETAGAAIDPSYSLSPSTVVSQKAAAEQERQRKQIQDALNQQTFEQFRSYAEQQFPKNPDQQAILIRQLQEQHYHQYMQQVYQQQMETHATNTIVSHAEERIAGLSINENQSNENNEENGVENSIDAVATANEHGHIGDYEENEENEENEDEEESCEEIENIPHADLWTKKEIVEFKESIRQEGGDQIIKVGQGETVTVRVPTHESGSAVYFEFATDSYDLGFGLFFEWQKSDDETEVSVHISESEDEDVDEDEYQDENGDPESAGAAKTLVTNGPPTSVLIPIFRRDCHQELYAGSHQYPGQGVYLLKFDNAYSFWRSKTLYYRIFYTQ